MKELLAALAAAHQGDAYLNRQVAAALGWRFSTVDSADGVWIGPDDRRASAAPEITTDLQQAWHEALDLGWAPAVRSLALNPLPTQPAQIAPHHHAVATVGREPLLQNHYVAFGATAALALAGALVAAVAAGVTKKEA